MIQDGNQCQDKCPAEHKSGMEGALKIKIRQRIAAAGRNSDETGHVSQKNGRTNYFMDISYYKCLLRKMNLFRPKNKLGCVSGAGSGRKRGERGGGQWKPAEENEAKK